MTAATVGARRVASDGRAAGDPGEAAGRTPWLQRPLTSYHLLVWSAAALLALGLVMVFSASSVRSYATSGSSLTVFSKQLLWFLLGVPLAVVAARLPVRVFRWLGYPLLVASAAGLLLVLVPGIGTSASGATRWIVAGPVQLQPSEPAKLALALWGADLLVRKRRLLGDWRHLVVPLVPVAGLFAALVMLEPDLGTTVSLLLVVVSLLFVVGAPLRVFGVVVGLAAAGAGVLALASPYRVARLVSFSNPCGQHAASKGWQACQGLYALSSGGWFGLGLGASREKWYYLPNAHTDYIFAIVGEELGLVGALVVVGLFGVLGYAGLRVATRTTDPFVRLASGAVTVWIVGQAFINMGYVAGLLPVTGVPLPMVSFGGTSLVLTMGTVGMLAAFARTEPGVAEQLAASGAGPVRRALSRAAFWRRGRPAPSPSTGASPPRPVPRGPVAGARRPARTATSARSRAGAPARRAPRRRPGSR